MPENVPAITHDSITQRIFEVRGQRAMLDSDLAVLYGVETKALVRAVKRNPGRFAGFVFQLSYEEWNSLRCQIGTSKKGRGGRRSAPYALTEHGALMLSSVLNSPRADEISRMIIQAFVWMRQFVVPAHKELAAKVAELEATVGKYGEAIGQHDAAIGGIIEALNELILPPDKDKRKIGF